MAGLRVSDRTRKVTRSNRVILCRDGPSPSRTATTSRASWLVASTTCVAPVTRDRTDRRPSPCFPAPVRRAAISWRAIPMSHTARRSARRSPALTAGQKYSLTFYQAGAQQNGFVGATCRSMAGDPWWHHAGFHVDERAEWRRCRLDGTVDDLHRVGDKRNAGFSRGGRADRRSSHGAAGRCQPDQSSGTARRSRYLQASGSRVWHCHAAAVWPEQDSGFSRPRLPGRRLCSVWRRGPTSPQTAKVAIAARTASARTSCSSLPRTSSKVGVAR